jgi:hypothetical protein
MSAIVSGPDLAKKHVGNDDNEHDDENAGYRVLEEF